MRHIKDECGRHNAARGLQQTDGAQLQSADIATVRASVAINNGLVRQYKETTR